MTEKAISQFDHTQLMLAVTAYGCRNFARAAGIGEKRLMRLLRGETEFRQMEIHRAAAVLRLRACEIDAYFFTPKVQKI